jgi:hypothetical protein
VCIFSIIVTIVVIHDTYLALGVYHERPPSSVEHDDAVIHTETVRRQAVDIPLSDLHQIP